jgi:hypothetical protein
LQVQNYVYWQKQKEGLSKPMTVHQLQQYCAKTVESTDIDKPFVVSSYLGEEASQGNFLIAWSTPRLLNLQRSSSLICLDATYKLTLDGFPILVNFLV